MNIEDTKKAIEVMQAYVDGKKIQYSYKFLNDCDWYTTCDPEWSFHDTKYRIKPEPNIIYVNEYSDKFFYGYAHPECARDNSSHHAEGVAVPYVRLSDVELLK